ncbi:hypothetical protein PIB30_069439 [Stylosanthes scabra]|uniref:Uncharacterized protein n=1 Tax=Stylosanthes scabra TaxID=79078 RepID=A0ABU6WLL1_9FABA|nr:hypothetical protein [Stylosanthes scabra]
MMAFPRRSSLPDSPPPLLCVIIARSAAQKGINTEDEGGGNWGSAEGDEELKPKANKVWRVGTKYGVEDVNNAEEIRRHIYLEDEAHKTTDDESKTMRKRGRKKKANNKAEPQSESHIPLVLEEEEKE